MVHSNVRKCLHSVGRNLNKTSELMLLNLQPMTQMRNPLGNT